MKSLNKKSKFLHRTRGALHDQYTYEDYISGTNYALNRFGDGFYYYNSLDGGFWTRPRVFCDDDDDSSLQAFLENNPGFKVSDK